VVDIEILYVDNCPNYKRACAVICDIIAEEGLDASISITRITRENIAEYPNFGGSPSVLVDGVDVEACYSDPVHIAHPTDLACRLYECKIHRGCPSHEMIRCAIGDALGDAIGDTEGPLL
jgi:hypothetical protein